MKTTSFIYATLAAAGAMMTADAMASVTVTFTEPEKYADMPFSYFDKQRIMDDLQRHFDKLGASLPAGQDLKIEILDIDLAGRIDQTARAPLDLRILRGGADWPTITLRYKLESQGKVLKFGEERIADMAYLEGTNHYNTGESLRYEKQMLDRWFKKTLLPAKTGG